MRPQIGQVTLLVYRECERGCWCATGEGESPPLCGEHSLPLMPGGGPAGMFGRTDGADHLDVRRRRRLGFAALFGYEAAMVRLIGRLRRLLGMVLPDGDRWTCGHFEDRPPSDDPYFKPREIAG